MKIKYADFIGSFVLNNQMPFELKADIAVIGRSNVGKSSFINCLLNRKSIAKTSSKPGKTRTINFFAVDDRFYLVDLPGYGFAKVSKKEKEKWGRMIESYLLKRDNLKGVFLLLDIRHEPSEDDCLMYEWLGYHKVKTILIATKADKIAKGKIDKNLKIIKNVLGDKVELDIIPFSSVTKSGKEEVLDKVNYLLEFDI